VRRVLRRVRHRWRTPLRAETNDVASRFVLAEFTDENYQVVWWIMAKPCVVVAVLVAFVAGPQGLVRSIPRRSAEPEPEHAGLLIMRWSSTAMRQGDLHPRI
jgi:hypothetical protein